MYDNHLSILMCQSYSYPRLSQLSATELSSQRRSMTVSYYALTYLMMQPDYSYILRSDVFDSAA